MAAYINDIIKRERDHNTNWYDASDGTMERGDYLLRNWRGDTSAVLTDGGNIVEYDKYSAYGTAKGIPGGDCDNDGDVYSAGAVIIYGWNFAPTRGVIQEMIRPVLLCLLAAPSTGSITLGIS